MFYPIESFSLEQKEYITKEKILNLEKLYIYLYDTFDNGFNLTTGGETYTMKPLSEDSKKKIGEKNKINMLGKKHSEKTKQLMSKSHKGYVKSESHRKNLSIAMSGRKISKEQKEKCRKANQGSKQKNSKYSEETIVKVKKDIMSGIPIKEISKAYNIPYRYIYSGIISDLRWRHVRPDGWDEYLKKRKIK